MKSKTLDHYLNDYFSEGVEAFLPHLSINCVVLAYRYPQLQVLVHKIPGNELRAIPGGFIKKTESVDEAAYRNLKLLGIGKVYLRQIRTFGNITRILSQSDLINIRSKETEKIFKWISQRFVTVVYYGLINLSETEVIPGGFADALEWLDVDHLDNLLMDHAGIVEETRKILATELLNYPVAMNLMPGMFTLNELRGLFEAILQRPIDRGTFRRKMLRLGIIGQVDERKDTSGRPSHLFRFIKANYNHFLDEEYKFGF